jgi:predicted Zn-dependent peptidase
MGLLTLPFRALLWIAQELAAQAERAPHDADALRAELVRLYEGLESGALSEEEFARREEDLAGRLAGAAR